jgi:hypothetical protein
MSKESISNLREKAQNERTVTALNALLREKNSEIESLRQQLAQQTSAEPVLFARSNEIAVAKMLKNDYMLTATTKGDDVYDLPLYTSPPSVEVLLEALRKIQQGTNKPMPDPNAHGWEAFGRAAMAMATDYKFIAINALSSYKPTEG